jgi:hypothetical protein
LVPPDVKTVISAWAAVAVSNKAAAAAVFRIVFPSPVGPADTALKAGPAGNDFATR